MSILIKGVEMPKNCFECLTTLGLFSKTCPISENSNIDVEFAKNHIYVGCPLVELPPHGRLIDADETKRVFGDYFEKVKVARRFAKSLVDNAIPTVIESEEE